MEIFSGAGIMLFGVLVGYAVAVAAATKNR